MSGRVINREGRPVAGASVIVTGAAPARTDTGGAFHLRTGAPGTLVVRVTAVGYAAQVRTLTPGVARTGLAFRLLPVSAQELAPIAVRGDRETANSPVAGYLARRSSTGLRLDVPLHDTPVSVQVVPRDVLVDRAALSVDEAVEHVSGVRVVESLAYRNAYQVRGFAVRGSTLRDGYREQVGQTDISDVERVEVIKGPAAAVEGGGQLNIGGVLNTVTKRPQADTRHTVEVLGGGQQTARGIVDLTGPLDSAGRVLYRLVGSAEHRGSYVDFQKTDNRTIAPSLTVRPTARDELRLAAELVHYRFPWTNGLPVNPAFLHLPASFTLAEPGLAPTTLDQQRATAEYAHAFAPALTLRAGGSVGRYRADIGEDRLFQTALAADGHTVRRQVSRGPQSSPSADGRLELLARVTTGSAAHALVAGVEQYWVDFRYHSDTASLAPFDLRAPRYGARPGPFAPLYDGHSGDRGRGVYVQDFVALGDKLKLLAGLRRDEVTTFSAQTRPSARPTGDEQRDARWSPRVGLTVEPTATTALYANASTAFVPALGVTRAGARLDPSRARQLEAGVKQDAAGGRLAGTLAVYQIDRTNVPTPDPADRTAQLTLGRQRSRGVEADVAGALTPAWRVIASYAFTDAVVTADPRIPVGARIPNVPRHGGSVWTTYDVPAGLARGVQVGGGVFAAARQPQGLPETFATPAYARLDAEAAYRVARYRVALNVKNLTDVRAYTGDGVGILRAASPRLLLASLRADF